MTRLLDLGIHNIRSFVIVVYDWYDSTSFAVVAVVALFALSLTPASQQGSAVVVVHHKAHHKALEVSSFRIEMTDRNIPDAK